MRIIKKYPNRRLYDTERSSYIKLSEVHALIRDGEEFQVVDAETGEDITRSILVQIIIDQENGATPLFTTDMLTKFIRFYDDATHGIFGSFLEKNLQFFADQQKNFIQQAGGMMDYSLPKMMQEATTRNLALWQDMQRQFFDMASGGKKKPSESDQKKDGRKT